LGCLHSIREVEQVLIMHFRVNTRTLDVLEWYEIQRLLAERARSPMGRRLCEEYVPGSLDIPSAQLQTEAVLEARALKSDKQWVLPLGDIPDLASLFLRIRRSGSISLEEFVSMVRFHKAAQALSYFIKKYAVEKKKLTQLLSGIDLLENWSRRHFELIDAQGQIVDSASEDLRALRSLARDLHSKIRVKLEDFMNNPRLAEIMQDFYITIREGRYVIPVKTNFKGRVPGIVHGVSNTEQTLYVEPQEIVEWNNQLKVTEMEIQYEIERILQEVVEKTKPAIGGFEKNIAIVAKADLLSAAASLVESWNDRATAAEWKDSFDFVSLIHPFLGLNSHEAESPASLTESLAPAVAKIPSNIVANDLQWKDAFVLSGPNTGGKTVLLKAAGLAVLLAWAGLPVPAQTASLPKDLQGLIADIGDDQSLEENLSTFSGHLNVLKQMLESAEPGDLVMIDEIATGTSPEDGQPLAQAVIEALLDKALKVFVTTHYGGVKQYAMIDDRCRIASMAFDRESRRPTYQVVLDIPGESSAFEIAERLGFPENVTRRARVLKGETSPELNIAISRLEEARVKLQKKEQALHEEAAKAEKREAKAQEKIMEYEAKQKEGLSEESRKILKELTALREELSQAVRSASPSDLSAGAKQLFVKLGEASEEVRAATHTQGKFDPLLMPLSDSELKVGLTVEVDGFGIGQIYETPKDLSKGAKALIAVKVGDLQVTVPRSKIFRAANERVQAQRSLQASLQAARDRKSRENSLKSISTSVSGGKSSSSVICDVRGKSVEEAMRRVESAFNELFHADNQTITVIHGHGSDRLKDAIRTYIEKERSDLKFRSGSWPGEGGDGVTLVERA